MGAGYSLDRVYREAVIPWLTQQLAAGQDLKQ
jgi:hypothetical protein